MFSLKTVAADLSNLCFFFYENYHVTFYVIYSTTYYA